VDLSSFQSDFFAQLDQPWQLQQLFEYLPDIYFFIKDCSCRFITVNSCYLEMCNLHSQEDIVGKTDFDFFPNGRAKKYSDDDKHVMRTAKPMVNIVELAPEYSDATNWVIVSKIPLFSHLGAVIGTAGFGRNFRKSRSTLQPYADLGEVIAHIDEHYMHQVRIVDLARMANLSVSQFERKFRSTFQLTPSQHIMQVRLKAACKLLSTTNRSVSAVALDCGFFDHSHFSRNFRQSLGMTPRQYRLRY